MESLNSRLLRLYAPLTTRTCAVCDDGLWPATAGVLRGLARDNNSRLVPTRFESQGPVGLASFPEKLRSVCAVARDELFSPFIRRLNEALAEAGHEPASVWWAPDSALHFTVYQITEHPVLLDEELKVKCRPLSQADDDLLFEKCQETLPGLGIPHVVMHGARIMPDGTMLLLFLEATAAEGAMDRLRSCCATLSRDAGQGDQPIRPKDFLHVVVGRVLEIPVLDNCRASLMEFVKSEALSLDSLETCGGADLSLHYLELSTVTLVRDLQWFHLEYNVLGDFALGPQSRN